jgi:hypothetical protein
MKGTLLKKYTPRNNVSWFVKYSTINGAPNIIPIHPKYVKCYFLDEDANYSEVDFEIVYDFHYGANNEGVYGKINSEYAKLIKPGETNTELKEENDVEQLADKFIKEEVQVASASINRAIKLGYVEGYNKAKEETYTEEQVKTAIKLAKMSHSSEAILQLLKTI